MIKKIFKLPFYILRYIFCKPISLFLYKQKYIKSRYFRGKLFGIMAIGWQWVLTDILARIFLRVNRRIPFPVSYRIQIVQPDNIIFHPDNLDNFHGFGNYYQAIGRITIGKGSFIAPNVGIITSNHVIGNLEVHHPPKEVILGEKCWIGMNSMILPGVMLGDNTVVGAGSVVTKSFPEGNCVIVGNPAKVIKTVQL